MDLTELLKALGVDSAESAVELLKAKDTEIETLTKAADEADPEPDEDPVLKGMPEDVRKAFEAEREAREDIAKQLDVLKQAKAEQDKRSVRKLLGRGAVHPNHAGRRGRIAIKG